MDLSPRHRLPFRPPGPWPYATRPPLLHSGDTGTGLLGLEGPVLTTTWEEGAWRSTLAGRSLDLPPWEALAVAVASGPHPWVGAASFELACDEADLPRQPLPPGTLGQRWAGVLEACYLGPEGPELWSWGTAPPNPAPWESRLTHRQASAPFALELAPAWGEERHHRAVTELQERILDGAFYVANLCVPFHGRLSGHPEDLARAAFAWARPPFGALLELGEAHLLCLSMERLLARRGDRIWSQPIKGSAPLTGDAERDRQAAAALLADPKERAEHTMIVDLVRNDLGRVARTGSVRVERTLAVEAFPTVQHLVSTVAAEALPGLRLPDLLRAVLPGGSVTGAPKHAVCAHLAATEAGPRGFYCGAAGWLSPTGDLDLALPIRTARIQGDEVLYWVGGGITRRSDPAREWQELLLKTRALRGPA